MTNFVGGDISFPTSSLLLRRLERGHRLPSNTHRFRVLAGQVASILRICQGVDQKNYFAIETICSILSCWKRKRVVWDKEKIDASYFGYTQVNLVERQQIREDRCRRRAWEPMTGHGRLVSGLVFPLQLANRFHDMYPKLVGSTVSQLNSSALSLSLSIQIAARAHLTAAAPLIHQ
ncbi:hypothetical protein Ciccas_004786 [Cichlidogyrus casuarinus]|uniref:Uncharacterized protein n=1 Tax=Cichlidogyrus casuarinus TaxID=1844966 RepID=A0ABD2QBG7_9PLAT